MATTIQDLEERVDALYNSILQMQQNLNPVTDKVDTTANTVTNTIPQVDNNTVGVAENDGAIMDVAELSDENATAIEELAALVDELMERVEALEG